MDEAVFSAHAVNTPRAAVEGEVELEDGSRLIWGLSRREFGPMSFGNRPPWDVAHNRMQFLKLWDLKIDHVVSPFLEHTAHVERVDRQDAAKGARSLDNALRETDALVTQAENLILLTTHADCLPLWLYAPGGWIGMAHMGWRGLAAGMVRELIQAVPEKNREGVQVAAGPGISAARYPVGGEVAERFLEKSTLAHAVQERDGQYYLDLVQGARLQAEEEGIRLNDAMFACTYENDYLSSFRRDGESFAPMAAFIVREGRG